MELNEIKERLKKEKDPEKFLKELLKKIKDKKLREEIEKLLKKKETRGESTLERVVRTSRVQVEEREPRLTINIPDVVFDEEAPKIRPDLVLGRKNEVDYGLRGSGGGDYATGSVIQKLEGSSLAVKGGHFGTAETQGLIDQKMGAYDIRDREAGKYSENKIYQTTGRESFAERTAFDEALGIDRDKKKKKLGDYV